MITDAHNRMDKPSIRKLPKGAEEAKHVSDEPIRYVPPHYCPWCGKGQTTRTLHSRGEYAEVKGRLCNHKWRYYYAVEGQKAHTVKMKAHES